MMSRQLDQQRADRLSISVQGQLFDDSMIPMSIMLEWSKVSRFDLPAGFCFDRRPLRFDLTMMVGRLFYF